MTDTTSKTAVSAAESNPGAIDLERIKKLCRPYDKPWRDSLPINDVNALIYAVEALRERVGEAELNEGALVVIRALLKEHGVPAAAFIDDHVAGAIVQRDEAVTRAEASQAHATELAEALSKIIPVLDRTAITGEIRRGHDKVKRLVETVLATLPAKTLERARIKEKIIKWASKILWEEGAIMVHPFDELKEALDELRAFDPKNDT